MPELPEVQSMIDTLIDDGCLNHKIIGVETIMPKLFKNSDFKEFENHIINEKIENISRIGKYLIFHISHKKVFVVHLRMEGKLFYDDADFPYNKRHTLVRIIFNNKKEIIFRDDIEDKTAYNVINFLYENFEGTIEIANDDNIISVISKNGKDMLPFKVDKKINIKEIETISNIIQINKMTPNAEQTEKAANIINERFKDVIAYPNIRTVDIVKNSVNKSNGVNFIYQLLKNDNQNIEKIITAGDSNNDIEMIKKYEGYVQINANQKIKSITNKYFNFISDVIYKEL